MITTMAYAGVSVLIAMVSSWVGSLIALRPLGKPPPVFWVERARLAYPARVVAALNTIFLPLIAGSLSFWVGGNSGNRATVKEIVAMAIGAYLGGLIVVMRTEKRVRGTMFRFGNWASGMGFRLVVLSPHLIALSAAAWLVPNTLNFQAIAILIPAILILTFGASAGGYLIAFWLGLARPASPRLARIVADATARTGIQSRGAYELTSPVASAVAILVWRRLLFTDKALEVLSDSEVAAVCVHELAHLSESRLVIMLRIFRGMVLILPLLFIRPIWGDFGKMGLYILWLGFLITLMLTRRVASRVARRMEIRADAAGREHQGEEGTYARALERLYEINLVPAVMSGKRRTHPDLYDRLFAAGVTPSYPRPIRPSTDVFSVPVTMIIAVVLYVLLFKALGGPVYFS
jgi:Zn-dependent protease with chaperone function